MSKNPAEANVPRIRVGLGRAKETDHVSTLASKSFAVVCSILATHRRGIRSERQAPETAPIMDAI